MNTSDSCKRRRLRINIILCYRHITVVGMCGFLLPTCGTGFACSIRDERYFYKNNMNVDSFYT